MFKLVPDLLFRRSIKTGVAQPSAQVSQDNGVIVDSESGAIGSLKSGDFEIDSVLE